MKNYIRLSLLLITLNGICTPGWSQECQEVKITDLQQWKQLKAYAEESFKLGHFPNNMGVVYVREYRDTLGRLVWNVWPIIDDRYKMDPPTRWANINGDIFLFFEADERGRRKQVINPTPRLINCLEEVIQDRLYIRPPKQKRMYIHETEPGKPSLDPGASQPRPSEKIRMMGGNPSNAKVFIFNQDGTVTTLKSV